MNSFVFFCVMRLEGTGYVSDADLCSIFQQLGDERLVDEELAEITREYNVTNEGAINYESRLSSIIQPISNYCHL